MMKFGVNYYGWDMAHNTSYNKDKTGAVIRQHSSPELVRAHHEHKVLRM